MGYIFAHFVAILRDIHKIDVLNLVQVSIRGKLSREG